MKRAYLYELDNGSPAVDCPYCGNRITWSGAPMERVHGNMYVCINSYHHLTYENEGNVFEALIPPLPIELVAERYK